MLFLITYRPLVLPVTRQSTGKLPPARQLDVINSAPGKIVIVTGKTSEEIKDKMEQQLRLQRAALNQKRALESKGRSIDVHLFFGIMIVIHDSLCVFAKPSQAQGRRPMRVVVVVVKVDNNCDNLWIEN